MRYGTDDIDEALRREQEDESTHPESLVAGLMRMNFCRNPKCRKTFEVPEDSRERPKYCPECRTEEGGLKVEEDKPKTCVEEGCEEPRREGKIRCDAHQKQYQNEMYHRNQAKKGKKHPHPPTPPPVEPVEPTTVTGGSANVTGVPLEQRVMTNIGDGLIEVSAGVIEVSQLAKVLRRLPAGATQAVLAAALYGYFAGRGMAA